MQKLKLKLRCMQLIIEATKCLWIEERTNRCDDDIPFIGCICTSILRDDHCFFGLSNKTKKNTFSIFYCFQSEIVCYSKCGLEHIVHDWNYEFLRHVILTVAPSNKSQHKISIFRSSRANLSLYHFSSDDFWTNVSIIFFFRSSRSNTNKRKWNDNPTEQVNNFIR